MLARRCDGADWPASVALGDQALEAAIAQKAAVASRAVTGVTAVTGWVRISSWAAQRETMHGLSLSRGLGAVMGVPE